MTQDEYLALFGSDNDDGMLGEASTDYLWSETAVPNILNIRPDAKFIVMLRKPSEAVPAFHATLLKSGTENVSDVEQAWRLQDLRASGECLPPGCRGPKDLQYREIFLYGEQMERLYSLVDREQVVVFLFEEFTADPSRSYRRSLELLGVPDDGRTTFPVVNPNLVYRSKSAFDLMRQPPRWARAVTQPLKRLLGDHWKTAKSVAMTRLAARPGKRAAVAPEFEAELIETFAEDIARLSHLLERDLSSWTIPRV